MSGSTLELTETDEAGNVIATYIQTSTVKRDVTRIDKIVNALRSNTQKLISNLCVGVGDASASATGALLLSIFQESMGRADIFNDAAMVLDCLSPAFPKPMRVLILASGSVLRSLCGVAAGSSKASLSAHFARWGNLGELNAKDSSQETVISLVGMLVGCLVVKVVITPLATWTTLLLLLTLHLATNYMAVRSVCMRTLNRQRANIVFACLHKHNRILNPKEVSAKERVFERDGILRDVDDNCLGYARIGIPASELLQRLGETEKLTKATNLPGGRLLQLLDVFEDEGYVLYLEQPSDMVCILLKKGSDTAVQLKAWYHALLLARLVRQGYESEKKPMDMVQSTLVAVRKDWERVQARLGEAGWDLDTAALETTSGFRVSILIIGDQDR
ncbi:DUF647-domain-containing protein [Aureobasidium pullulans]|uniref:DUF647-domain-containing protein n=2 Tax=Aureobasidium pullulans TaxID=5580 RepID=A0A4V6TI63_AURPU|nr:DUF647-domain-containing protein [Aureobasidium pullulans]